MHRRVIGVGTKISIGFAISLLMLVLVGAIARGNATSLRETAQLVSHSQRAVLTLAQLTARVREREATVRGYALTGNRAMLEKHLEVRPSIERYLSSLRLLLRGEPEQLERLAALELLLERKLGFQDELELTRQQQGLEAAVRLADTGEGLMAMEAILATTSRIEAQEMALLAARDEEADASVQRAGVIIAVVVLLAMLMVVIAGVLIGRDIALRVARQDMLLETSRVAAQQLSSAAAELLSAAQQQATGAANQASSVAETAVASEQIVQIATQAKASIESVAEVSRHASTLSSSGKRAVEDTMARIAELRERVASMAASISTLSRKAEGIRELNAAVEDIAEISHLLALNAAIEAARAGEHGRGFMVVANEVGALAQRSKETTAQVRNLVADMRSEAARGASTAEGGTASAEDAVQSAKESGEMFRQLADSVTRSADAAQQVAASAAQQVTGVTQIQEAIRDIHDVTTQVLASTRQIEAASHDLNQLSRQLHATIGSASDD